MMPSVVPMPSSWTWLAEMVEGSVPMPPVAMNSSRTSDHHDVVDDRGPHRRGEVTARVQDRAGQRAHPVEEDLRDEEVREDHHQVVLGAGDGVGVQVDQQARGQRGQHGEPEQRAVTRVNIRWSYASPPSRVPLGRADQQRDHDTGQDAAEHQVVDRVRQRVGVVVRVGDAGHAERIDEHQRAQETGDRARPACRRPSPSWSGAGCRPQVRGRAGRGRRRPERRRLSAAAVSAAAAAGPRRRGPRRGVPDPGRPGPRSRSWITPLPAWPVPPAWLPP